MLCENCHLNEAEVKLTVKSKEALLRNGYVLYVLKVKTLGKNETPSHSQFQDDIEEAFVVKQILQHLATKHGIISMSSFSRSDVQRVR